jgi:hypothetical protein
MLAYGKKTLAGEDPVEHFNRAMQPISEIFLSISSPSYSSPGSSGEERPLQLHSFLSSDISIFYSRRASFVRWARDW